MERGDISACLRWFKKNAADAAPQDGRSVDACLQSPGMDVIGESPHVREARVGVHLALRVAGLAFLFSSRRRRTKCLSDWSSDVCPSDLRSVSAGGAAGAAGGTGASTGGRI